MNAETILKEQPFFAGLSKKHIAAIAESAELLKFSAGEFVFRQNEEADSFYLILSGKVDVELGPVLVQSIEPGQVVGWSWLVAPYRWRLDARTVEATQALRFSGNVIREKMEQDPVLGYELLRRFFVILTERVESELLQLLSVYAAHS